MRLILYTFVIVLLNIAESALVQAAIDKKFHLITSSKMNWYEALNNCNSRGMHLAALFSKEENDRLIYQINESGIRENFWTAGTRLGNEPYYYWMGHTKPMDFFNWSEEKANKSGSEDCFELSSCNDFKWNDVLCSKRLFTVCESEAPYEENKI